MIYSPEEMITNTPRPVSGLGKSSKKIKPKTVAPIISK
jgi:hypothetical protein